MAYYAAASDNPNTWSPRPWPEPFSRKSHHSSSYAPKRSYTSTPYPYYPNYPYYPYYGYPSPPSSPSRRGYDPSYYPPQYDATAWAPPAPAYPPPPPPGPPQPYWQQPPWSNSSVAPYGFRPAPPPPINPADYQPPPPPRPLSPAFQNHPAYPNQQPALTLYINPALLTSTPYYNPSSFPQRPHIPDPRGSIDRPRPRSPPVWLPTTRDKDSRDSNKQVRFKPGAQFGDPARPHRKSISPPSPFIPPLISPHHEHPSDPVASPKDVPSSPSSSASSLFPSPRKAPPPVATQFPLSPPPSHLSTYVPPLPTGDVNNPAHTHSPSSQSQKPPRISLWSVPTPGAEEARASSPTAKNDSGSDPMPTHKEFGSGTLFPVTTAPIYPSPAPSMLSQGPPPPIIPPSATALSRERADELRGRVLRQFIKINNIDHALKASDPRLKDLEDFVNLPKLLELFNLTAAAAADSTQPLADEGEQPSYGDNTQIVNENNAGPASEHLPRHVLWNDEGHELKRDSLDNLVEYGEKSSSTVENLNAVPEIPPSPLEHSITLVYVKDDLPDDGSDIDNDDVDFPEWHSTRGESTSKRERED